MKTRIRALEREIEKNRNLVQNSQTVFLNTYSDMSAFYDPRNANGRPERDVDNVRNLKKFIKEHKKQYEGKVAEIDDIKRKLRTFKPKFAENEIMCYNKNCSELISQILEEHQLATSNQVFAYENDMIRRREHELENEQMMLLQERKR
jgi:hypothetical protein